MTSTFSDPSKHLSLPHNLYSHSQSNAENTKYAEPDEKLFEPLPVNSVVTDYFQDSWIVGRVIDKGGQGSIYETQENSFPSKHSDECVLKVTPMDESLHETQFYTSAGCKERVQNWITKRNMYYLGIPKLISMGSLEHNGVMYQFFVMKRYGPNLEEFVNYSGKPLCAHTVFILSLKLIDVLEYLHSSQFVHADIKASNIVFHFKDVNQVYLIDYGLASRYILGNTHISYKECPDLAHYGTLEFTSRDAHRGVDSSRRADMEILGYCILKWLSLKLPWEDESKVNVGKQKSKYMDNVEWLLEKCSLNKQPYSGQLTDYLTHVAELGYKDQPDYHRCRMNFKNALKTLDHKPADCPY